MIVSVSRSQAPLFALLVLALCLTACGSTKAVSEQELRLEEARLVAPYRAKRTIVCDYLVIEASVNFNAEIARPATTPETQVVEGGDDVYRWSAFGGIQNPLRFEVGEVELAALQTAELRFRGSGKALALNVTAAGTVTVAEAGSDLRNCTELQITEGVYRTR